ncbi:MAG: hypothetical protein HFI57_12080 [Lachnospiraceae bacterium]|nr:hypothetical protein [Lachnospiraceae bacterium]
MAAKVSQYENEFSAFPSQLITRHNFKNVDDEASTMINHINSLRSQGSYLEAAQYIDQKKNVLSQYIVDAVTFRTWEEEIYNTQKYAKQAQQAVYFEDEEPDYCLEDDVWLGV